MGNKTSVFAASSKDVVSSSAPGGGKATTMLPGMQSVAPPPPPTTGKVDMTSTSDIGADDAGGKSVRDYADSSSFGTTRTNPGTYEELFRKVKEIEPQVFEGFKLMFNKPLSSHFQVSHTVTISQQAGNSGYRFGAIFAGKNMVGPQEAYPLLIGDIEPSGNLNGQVITMIGPRSNPIRFKMIAQVQKGILENAQFSLDHRAKTFSTALTLGQLDLASRQGLCIGQYLQSLTPRLALGAELMYQWSPQIPGGQMFVLGLGGKFSGGAPQKNWTLAASGNPASAHVAFYQQISDMLQVAVDWETSLRAKQSIGSLSYAFDLAPAGVTFRGQIDTNWTVSATMEKRLQPSPITFILSGAINHRRNMSQFGVGVMIGSS